ncbi:adenylate/guanylate cyclase domain-containing protein [Mycobacterium tilburgii]|uniref:adenylate/guanylate cyclase domain-containing protein n=1 Tax=Mycobacterium tilburgii TaxID=44467 RepID=UPI0021B3BA1A
MPESVAQRYREGQETISQKHQDVAIVFADIVGLDEISNDHRCYELVGIVDDLLRQFDAAAESLGVEWIRTFQNGYLASCAPSPRDWTASTEASSSLEMRQIIDRFNSQSGLSER